MYKTGQLWAKAPAISAPPDRVINDRARGRLWGKRGCYGGQMNGYFDVFIELFIGIVMERFLELDFGVYSK